MDSVKSLIARVLYKPENGLAEQASEFYLFMVACFILPLVLLKMMLRPRYKLPPSPPSYPILGHLHLLGELPHQSMRDLAKKYGDIYLLRLGSVPAIVVTTPQMAREFLQKHDITWASRAGRSMSAVYLSYDYKGIVSAPYSPVWRDLRKICMKELFTNRRMEASSGVREEEMRNMIRSLFNDGQQGQAVDFKLKLNMLTANVMARLVLNRRFTGYMHPTAEEEAKAHDFKDIIEELFILAGAFVEADFLPWLRVLDIGGKEKRLKALRVRLDAFLDDILDEHKEKRCRGAIEEKDKDMVDVLLNAMYEQNPADHTQRIDINEIKSTILNMFAGGTDTSTVTVEWAMSELLRHPQCMAKLQAELDAVVGKDRLVQESDVASLRYLQAVVKETFRMHPVGPLLVPHESIGDSIVAGYEIPAGTRLYVNIYAIGRDERVWERPDVFDPERFMAGRDANIDLKGTDFRLLPFGAGRRGCPGIALGLIMVERTTATLVHAFDWSLPRGDDPSALDMTESFGLTVSRKHALVTIATPRLDARLY